MVRFFFHLTDGEQRLSLDDKGYEFGDLNAAKRAAKVVARELFNKGVLPEQEPDQRQFEITDADGRVISTLRLTEVARLQR